MKLLYLLPLLLFITMVYLFYFQREGFKVKGLKIHNEFKITDKVNEVKKAKAKYIIIIPYAIGMHKLNTITNKMSKYNNNSDKIYIYVVENQEKASEFLSKICSSVIDLSTSSVILLAKNKNRYINSLYIESTNMVLTKKINKLLQ